MPQESATATASGPGDGEHHRKVLIAEDDAWIRWLLADLLPTEGYVVAEARDGLAALRMARADRPDVVLLDLAMPALSGLNVLHALKADRATRDIPIIIISAYTADLERAGPVEVDGVIQKPFDFDELVRQVQRATQRCA